MHWIPKTRCSLQAAACLFTGLLASPEEKVWEDVAPPPPNVWEDLVPSPPLTMVLLPSGPMIVPELTAEPPCTILFGLVHEHEMTNVPLIFPCQTFICSRACKANIILMTYLSRPSYMCS